MNNPKTVLIECLQNLGFIQGETLFLQGTMNPDIAYPELFITFWTDFTESGSHYNNSVNSINWHFSVIVYASDPDLLNREAGTIIRQLRASGFVLDGTGQDILSDEPTHTGWAMDFIYKINQ